MVSAPETRGYLGDVEVCQRRRGFSVGRNQVSQRRTGRSWSSVLAGMGTWGQRYQGDVQIFPLGRIVSLSGNLTVSNVSS